VSLGVAGILQDLDHEPGPGVHDGEDSDQCFVLM
jgi:hypothetical protein